MDLTDSVAIVTGGGRGIGHATALQLAERGAVVVVAARTGKELDRVLQKIAKAGGTAMAVHVDVTEKASVSGLVAQTLKAYGRVDVLINNAGVAIHNPIERVLEEDWDRNIDVNLKGTFLCTQAVFSHMCARGSGHIVNVSSISGKNGHPQGAAYCAAKFGVVGLTQVTDAEGRPHGVKATVVCPGPVDTRMRWENHPSDDPVKLSQPEDVAAAILFALTQPERAHTLEVVVQTPLM